MALCRKPFNGVHGCGQCIPCRLNKRRLWQSRIMLESYMHDLNGFLTLTYEKVPKDDRGFNILRFNDLRDFFKRLRSRGVEFRYYAVGEYGHDGEGSIDASGEQWFPHFHAAMFGLSCLGKIQRPETGLRCWCEVCELVREVWSFGNITFDELNPTTAAYIAGYTMKKMTSSHDLRLCGRPPEASRMSLKPGIGALALDVMSDEVSRFGDRVLTMADVPRDVLVGRKKSPLGRYLRERWRKRLDLYKFDPFTGEVSYGTPEVSKALLSSFHEPELSALQEDIKVDPSPEKFVEFDRLRASVRSRQEQKCRNIEAKNAIYRGVKKL